MEREPRVAGFLARTRIKEATRSLYVYVEEDGNYRSGTENAGLHQTLRGTILDKYSCFRIASMPPILQLSHFIGTGYVKNLLAPDSGRERTPRRQQFRRTRSAR